MVVSPSRVLMVLFVAVALAATGMFAAITLGAIAAVETGGSRFASGVPSAVAIAGTALGALYFGSFMERRGRRAGLLLGWVVAIAGGVLAAVAVEIDVFWLLLPSMFAIGAGNGAAQLARYAAAELVGPERRGSAVSLIVWAATVGAVAGPLALGPVGRAAGRWELAAGTGGYLFVAAAMLVALLVSLFLPVMRTGSTTTAAATSPHGANTPGLSRTAQAAILGLVVAQAAMVSVMTLTPVHLRDGHHAYGVVGTVMSGHFVGMFALAPAVGWLVDKLGAVRMMLVGQVVLVAGALTAAWLPVQHGVALSAPLMLIGLGWCACFVSTSAVVATALPAAGKARTQGRIDSLVWGSSATASLLAGVLLGLWSYATVALAAASVVTATAAAVGFTRARERGRTPATPR